MNVDLPDSPVPVRKKKEDDFYYDYISNKTEMDELTQGGGVYATPRTTSTHEIFFEKTKRVTS